MTVRQNNTTVSYMGARYVAKRLECFRSHVTGSPVGSARKARRTPTWVFKYLRTMWLRRRWRAGRALLLSCTLFGFALQYAGYATRVQNPPHWKAARHFASVHEKVHAHVSCGLSPNLRVSFILRAPKTQKQKIKISEIIWYKYAINHSNYDCLLLLFNDLWE